ncbi:uncharacterized protein LOC107619460 isoform X1 [Arachis ipaensis]|uniref:uncharacterized protein LOC107619460 isoform X1 n=1 Tax=Arachis ipaensis TaxID=130454 RepID=UPI000A2AF9B9|nr:uncharacterized protein LOC107619460 isoform X1 [Arachis ipaensis]
MLGKAELLRVPQSSAATPPKMPPSPTRGTVNSSEDLEATHLAAVKHAGEAEILRVPYHQRRLHHKTLPENPRRVTGSPRSTPIAAIPKQGCEGRTASRATNQRRLHHKMPPEPREESLEARELCCRCCSTAKVLPILGPLPAVHETVEPPSTVRHPELSRPLPVPGKLESRYFYPITRSRWFAEKMIEVSPFSSLDHATSFARQLWFNQSRIQSWLDAFSGQSHLYRAIRDAPASLMRELLFWDRKYRAKFGFEFITSTELWFTQKILDEVKVILPILPFDLSNLYHISLSM